MLNHDFNDDCAMIIVKAIMMIILSDYDKPNGKNENNKMSSLNELLYFKLYYHKYGSYHHYHRAKVSTSIITCLGTRHITISSHIADGLRSVLKQEENRGMEMRGPKLHRTKKRHRRMPRVINLHHCCSHCHHQ